MYELERRKAMLRAVHEWVQNGRDERPTYEDIATLVGGGQYVPPAEEDPRKQATKVFHAEQLDLFRMLVHEGLIEADIIGKPFDGVPYVRARLRGLTPQGLELIQE